METYRHTFDAKVDELVSITMTLLSEQVQSSWYHVCNLNATLQSAVEIKAYRTGTILQIGSTKYLTIVNTQHPRQPDTTTVPRWSTTWVAAAPVDPSVLGVSSSAKPLRLCAIRKKFRWVVLSEKHASSRYILQCLSLTKRGEN